MKWNRLTVALYLASGPWQKFLANTLSPSFTMHFFTCKSCFSFWTLWRSRSLDRGFLPNKSSAGETPVDVWEVMRNRLSWYSGFHTSFFDLLGAFFEGFDGPFSRSIRGMMVWSRSDMPDLIHLQEVVELVSDKIAARVGPNHFRESVSCKSDPQPSYRCARGWACHGECLNQSTLNESQPEWETFFREMDQPYISTMAYPRFMRQLPRV